MRRQVSFRPVDDFSMIGMISEFPYVIAVHTEHPASGLQQLIDLARSAQRPLLFGTPGQGSAQHLLTVLLARLSKVELQHVPFGGGVQALTELLAKRLDILIDAPIVLSEHLKSGRIRALAVTTRGRSPLLPDVPTVNESGIHDFDVRGWIGLAGPAGLPDLVVKRLNSGLAAILTDASVVERLHVLASEPRPSAPDDLSVRLNADLVKWAAVITEAGIERL
jgi:tripartite-type tricarboxylate transporter receptor subunit TctC